ncbi:MAG: UPF0175 family protein [Desulfococcaceae bacterium]
MQTLTIQSDHITLPVEIFQRLKGKKVEFVEYHEGVFIKPVSDIAGKTIPVFLQNHMEEDELLQEIAVLLYQKDKMTLGQASRLARMSQIQFQRMIADRQIPVHYDTADFESDIKTLQKTGRI